MRIALGQISSTHNPQDNLATIRDWTGQAAAAGASLIVFPEAALMPFDGDVAGFARDTAAEAHQTLASLSRETGVAVVAGSFELAADGRTLNALVASLPDGSQTIYHKIHLFDAFGYQESATIAPGDAVSVVDVAGVSVGLSTCYDLRFPELYRTMASRGAAIQIVSASWGDGPGKAAQWDLLTRARALDSTSWVIAVGQAVRDITRVGEPTGAPLGVGHSGLIGPDGVEHLRLGAAAELAFADLEPTQVEDVRAAIPVLANARLPLS